MAWTQTDLDAIKAAIASGAKVVKYADKEVVYQSMEDMRTALSMITAEVSGGRRKGRVYGIFQKR